MLSRYHFIYGTILLMKIAILGYAGQGKSAFEYWNKQENDITICDSNANTPVPSGIASKLGDDYLADLDEFDLLIRTPALHPRAIQAANPNSPNILDKVWTNTNEFLKVCPTRNIIGVTGTKGKGTTSTLITHILDNAGFRVHLGGNIGIPPLDMLANAIQPDDWVILELANFQLIDLESSPHIATCLMIEAEHLNWHDNIDEYIEAKRQLFVNQSETDIAVYYAENNYSKAIAGASAGLMIPYMAEPGAYVTEQPDGTEQIVIDGQYICDVSQIQLLGRHNLQNICAAITTVWNITQDISSIRQTVTSFQGLPHRLEEVRTVNNVTYYNDSFSSAPGATIAAINAIPGSKIIIIGGVDKNLDLNELARNILQHKDEIHKVILIGQVKHKLEQALQSHGFDNYDVLAETTMSEIVNHTKNIARPGDSVILSPGTSSFDMFKNFEDRGNKFRDAVNAL